MNQEDTEHLIRRATQLIRIGWVLFAFNVAFFGWDLMQPHISRTGVAIHFVITSVVAAMLATHYEVRRWVK